MNGSTATLNCRGSTPEGDPRVTWSTSIPGLALPQPTQITLDEYTVSSSITLDSVSSSYSGVYVCNVSDGIKNVANNISLSVIGRFQTLSSMSVIDSTIHIDIYYSPVVLTSIESNATLFCNASDYPDLEYSWERSPLPFNFTSEYDQSRVSGLNSSVLTIVNVEEMDAMDYICSVFRADEPMDTPIGTRTVSLIIPGEIMSNRG